MVSYNQESLFVTLIIVAYNEEAFIKDLLDDFLQQDYPAHLRELIMVDSASDDATKRIAMEFAKAHPELAIIILDNPKRIQPPGLNLALRAARGDIVCRLLGHVSIPPDYLSKGVQLLLEKKKERVVCVGGPWQIVGKGVEGQAIAAVLSTPFGVGNAKYRYSKTAGYVDTLPGGIYWKWALDEVGFYREDLIRAEDNELHARIRAKGWKFFLSPGLKTRYYCRQSIRNFLPEEAFGNGYWIMISWRESSWRHMVPLAFVVALMVFGFGSLLWEPFRVPFYIIISIYGLSALAVAVKIAFREKKWQWILALPPLFLLMHLSYGIGSLWGLFNNIFFSKNE
jgi:glycosyltransferase involved in cell wall biosynthesis